jgi:hypothetical protein
MAILKKHQFPNAPDRTPQVNQILADAYFKHHSPYTHKPIRHKYNIVKYGEEERVEEVREMVVHTFTMGDVEDPDLFAAQPLYEWEQSDFGQWVMKNSADTPTWYRMADVMSFGYRYEIRAKFMGPALTEMLLRKG